MEVIHSKSKRISKGDAVKILGLKTFDTALPQPWVDDIVGVIKACADIKSEHKEDIYGRVLSSFVWSYDDTPKGKTCFGYPQPLTIEAFMWLKLLDRVRHTLYAQEHLCVLDV